MEDHGGDRTHVYRTHRARSTLHTNAETIFFSSPFIPPAPLSAPISSRIFVIRELPSVSIFSVSACRSRTALHSADSRGIRLFVSTIETATLPQPWRSHNALLEGNRRRAPPQPPDDNEVCLVPEIMGRPRYKLRRASPFQQRVST